MALQHIAGPGDMRQIDLGLDFFFAAQRRARTWQTALRFGRAAEVGPHLFRFVLLQRTGVRLLLRNPDSGSASECFALNFQLPGQIVDSNLTHPAFLFSRSCA